MSVGFDFNGLRLHTTGGGYHNVDTLNAAPATLMLGYTFIAVGPAISYFWVNVGSVYGTDANRSITFELQTDSAGVPSGTALATYTVTAGWTANTQRKIDPSWSGVSLTEGTRYWIVFKNAAAAPATDYMGFNRYYPQVEHSTIYGALCCVHAKRQFNGTNWTTVAIQHSTVLTVRYTDGVLDGIRSRSTVVYDSSWVVGSSRAIGAELRLPNNLGRIRVRAAGLSFLYANATKLHAYVNRAKVAESPYAYYNTGSSVIILPLNFEACGGDLIAILSDTGTWSGMQVDAHSITNDPDFISLKPMQCNRVKLESGVWAADSLVTPGLSLYFDLKKPFRS